MLLSTGLAAVIGMQFGLAANVAIVLGMGLAFSSTAVGMQVKTTVPFERSSDTRLAETKSRSRETALSKTDSVDY